jgi:hypothetical protein
MTKLEQYEHILATKGISLAALGLREVALPTGDALDGVRVLKELSVPILGGDVYFEELEKVKPGYANWHVDRRDGETRQEFALRSCLKAEDYIAKFPRQIGGQPLFVLVPWFEYS